MPSLDADPFADIRPYSDDEVPAVVARLRNDPELADALARLKLKGLNRWLPGLARFAVRRWLNWALSGLRTVDDFQILVKPQLERVIASTASFTFDGLERLSADESWLFISNHRDISMDPALTNLVIHASGHRTLAIAIGDNLIKRAWVADLMRLNKCFLVRRNITAPRELMAASKQLASFMRWMISENRGPVWIAQREGRAKDGIDATEPAVIKMLTLSRDRGAESVAEVLSSLKIVPLAISYELDPCDGLKAAALALGDAYTKGDDEDVLSIGLGISGQKGRVHLSFGPPISGDDLDVESVAAVIDLHIRNRYRLYENALWAWQMLEGTTDVPPVEFYQGTITRSEFEGRIRALPEEHRPYALAMYANPLRVVLADQGIHLAG